MIKRHSPIRPLAAACFSVALSLNPALSHAVEAGDWLIRAGAAQVAPSGDSDDITSTPTALPAGSYVEADSTTSLGITVTYMATDTLGVGLLAAWPFSHDIDAKGAISGLGNVGETDQLPPTLTLQWHFLPAGNIRPYIGAGINYTTFFDEDTNGALATHDLELDDSWGYALDAGVDIDINSDWYVSGQVWYLDIDTEAKLSGATYNAKFDVEIDPWVYMIGVGTRF